MPETPPAARVHTDRASLLQRQAPFNQIRNVIYHLIRFMQERRANVPEELRRMGRDIAKTFARYWTPPAGGADRAMQETYKFVFGSKVKVDRSGSVLRVVDKKCRLCKMKYPDIDHAGCEIIASLVAELFTQARMQDLGRPQLTLLGVEESRARGNDRCVHLYEVK